MTAWVVAASVLLVFGIGPALARASVGRAIDRLPALNLAGVTTCLLVVVLAQALGRTAYVDVALVLAPLSFAGSLVFTRLLREPER